MCIIDKPSHNSVSHYYSHFTDEEIGSEWLRGSAPGHTAFNSESGIGPPRFVLGAWPALSAVGVGTPPPRAFRCSILRGQTSSWSEPHCTLPAYGLRRLCGRSLSAGSGPYIRNTGRVGEVLRIGDRLHGGHHCGRWGHRSHSLSAFNSCAI